VGQSGGNGQRRRMSRGVELRRCLHRGTLRQSEPPGLAVLRVADEGSSVADGHRLTGNLEQHAAELPAGVEELEVARLQREGVLIQGRRGGGGPCRLREKRARLKAEPGQGGLAARAGRIEAEAEAKSQRRQ